MFIFLYTNNYRLYVLDKQTTYILLRSSKYIYLCSNVGTQSEKEILKYKHQ